MSPIPAIAQLAAHLSATVCKCVYQVKDTAVPSTLSQEHQKQVSVAQTPYLIHYEDIILLYHSIEENSICKSQE
jgi:hypothetical protein